MNQVLLMAVACALAAPAQEPKGKVEPAQSPPKVDPRRVDAAIQKGVGYLKANLDSQKADGSWLSGSNGVWDTCFAVLFLRRATRPLIDVPSVDRFSPKK